MAVMTTAAPKWGCFLVVVLFVVFNLTFMTDFTASLTSIEEDEDPKPRAWPVQFHSVLVMNYSGELQIIDLWYDWPNGRNFNIIRHQLGSRLFDLEWNNGTSFFYTLDGDGDGEYCRNAQLEVGILRPNWLDGAAYQGQRRVDGFLCNVWQKADFIWYYEDVLTKRPVHWRFYTGREAHVMTFEVGAVLEDSKWQAPSYCFESNKDDHTKINHALGRPKPVKTIKSGRVYIRHSHRS
ncbi:hypothetical protein Nepgr_016911 [Nepenthes gracilis]|uniref:Uncharacterized protein n=1 Tax=Nepenthes gracilis TaxID=150966 RepID=A0AAD3SQK8_NEPGR|nr:hypothetical protein Nepgr_016911 [Nepenthes gracilis]